MNFYDKAPTVDKDTVVAPNTSIFWFIFYSMFILYLAPGMDLFDVKLSLNKFYMYMIFEMFEI